MESFKLPLKRSIDNVIFTQCKPPRYGFAPDSPVTLHDLNHHCFKVDVPEIVVDPTTWIMRRMLHTLIDNIPQYMFKINVGAEWVEFSSRFVNDVGCGHRHYGAFSVFQHPDTEEWYQCVYEPRGGNARGGEHTVLPVIRHLAKQCGIYGEKYVDRLSMCHYDEDTDSEDDSDDDEDIDEPCPIRTYRRWDSDYWIDELPLNLHSSHQRRFLSSRARYVSKYCDLFGEMCTTLKFTSNARSRDMGDDYFGGEIHIHTEEEIAEDSSSFAVQDTVRQMLHIEGDNDNIASVIKSIIQLVEHGISDEDMEGLVQIISDLCDTAKYISHKDALNMVILFDSLHFFKGLTIVSGTEHEQRLDEAISYVKKNIDTYFTRALNPPPKPPPFPHHIWKRVYRSPF